MVDDEDVELKRQIQLGRQYIEDRERMLQAGEPVTPSAVAIKLGVTEEEAAEIMHFADHDLGETERMMIEERVQEYRNTDGSKIDRDAF